MTRRMMKLVLSISAVLVASTGVMSAAETRVATVTVPFAFRAGSETLPAGEYSISKTDQSVLFLRSKGKTVALLPVGSKSATFDSRNLVRFERLGVRHNVITLRGHAHAAKTTLHRLLLVRFQLRQQRPRHAAFQVVVQHQVAQPERFARHHAHAQ